MMTLPMNFLDDLMHHSRMQPERAAIVMESGRCVDWGQFGAGVRAARSAIRRNGIAHEDLVSLECSDPIWRLSLLCALMREGICVINSSPETTALSAGLGARIFLCDHASAPPPDLLPHDARLLRVDDAWFLPPAGDPPVGPDLVGDNQVAYEHGCPAIVFFTSGTTGVPAARAFSFDHFNIGLSRRQTLFSHIDCRRVLVIPDAASAIGLNSIFASMMSGRTVFCVKTIHAPKAIGLYRIEFLIASTYLINAIVDTLKNTRLPSETIRAVWFGGGVASPELLAAITTYMTPNILNVYGSTEANTTAIMPFPAAGQALGMAGVVAPGKKISIVDEDGAPVANETPGEIWVQSDHLAMPFVSRTQRVEPEPGHVFRTGDIGHIDHDGHLVVTGRKSDFINLGGVRFLPDAIENFLVNERGIEDAAAVSILPRDGMIEELHIFVVTRTRDPDELKQDLHVKLGLARPHKLRIVASIPRNSQGKIARGELRDAARASQAISGDF